MTAVERIPDITTTPAWTALRKHHGQIGRTHLREFFADDPDRGRYSTDASIYQIEPIGVVSRNTPGTSIGKL